MVSFLSCLNFALHILMPILLIFTYACTSGGRHVFMNKFVHVSFKQFAHNWKYRDGAVVRRRGYVTRFGNRYNSCMFPVVRK